MTQTLRTKCPALAAAIVLLASAGFACSRQHPARNTTSDPIAFSRIDKAWAYSQGAGVTIAVIDWQFDPNAKAAANFVFATSMVPGEKMGDLDPWHGAWMVDTVHRVAPEARIIPIIGRSLKQRGLQDTLIQGIRYAAEHGAAAVTSSMGTARQSQALQEAIDDAERRGTLFVDVHPEDVAVPGQPFVPCRVNECDRRIVHAGIVSVPEHPASPHPSRDVYTWPYDFEAKFEDGWGFSNGPPVVGGVIALVKSANPLLSPQQIRDLLVQTTYDREGFKVLDAEAAVRAAIASRPPTAR
jgi:hypothetical protein